MKCANLPQRPLQWLRRHAYTQTQCATIAQSMCRGNAHTHTHTYTPATSQQPTNHATNQPTNQPTDQPAKLSCPRTNQRTTNQPTPRGRCVTASPLPAMCAYGVGLSSVLLQRQELYCVGLWYALSPLLPGYGTPPLCVHWYLACWLVGCWFSGCLVGWLSVHWFLDS